jgi:hypothetical protein
MRRFDRSLLAADGTLIVSVSTLGPTIRCARSRGSALRSGSRDDVPRRVPIIGERHVECPLHLRGAPGCVDHRANTGIAHGEALLLEIRHYRGPAHRAKEALGELLRRQVPSVGRRGGIVQVREKAVEHALIGRLEGDGKVNRLRGARRAHERRRPRKRGRRLRRDRIGGTGREDESGTDQRPKDGRSYRMPHALLPPRMSLSLRMDGSSCGVYVRPNDQH